jgi:phosphoribosyl 1,2-cyclic phosphodiesterase
MIRICLLGSGSSGNATLVSSGNTHVLIDCGLTARRIARQLGELGLTAEKLAGILISHEHTDHIRGLGTLLRNVDVPIVASRLTAGEITGLNGAPPPVLFEPGEPFAMGELEIQPFDVSHDAVEPCGFVFRARGAQAAYVTDLGCITELVRRRVRGSHCLIIESNHDEDMLKVGPYPWPLKQRVMSRLGHLSNRALAEFLAGEFDGAARTLVLAHLSRQNNHPELARQAAADALANRSLARAEDCRILVAEHHRATPVITVE